ncbi:unnamed protein product [Rotaria socialis]
MTQSHNEFDDHFITTNQDYGSFYCGRLQYSRTTADNIALELFINDQVRNERRQLKSIAYDILFDPEILADALAENMIAITVPHEYLGMPFINPNQSYPGTETDCSKTSGLQHLLEHFQEAKVYYEKMFAMVNSILIRKQLVLNRCMELNTFIVRFVNFKSFCRL